MANKNERSLLDSQILEAIAAGEARPIPEGEVLFIPEAQGIKSPEFPDKAPDKLWRNLGLYPGMRDNLEGKAFYSEAFQPLNVRLKELTEQMLRGMLEANPDLTVDMFNEFKKTTPNDGTFINLSYGFALGIEAFQIAENKNLIDGFRNVSIEDYKESLVIPELGFWNQDPIMQTIDRNNPPQEFAGLYEDARQIGNYALRDSLQFGVGAWQAARIVTNNWRKIYSPGLPSYQPSKYVDKNGGIKGI